ncbi:MAG TPA: STAS domain-containing protein [Candidatus Acidoferrales bacterium]
MSWEIRERAAGSVTVVELAGRITLGDSGDGVEARLQEIINSGVRALLLDLSRVEALDSRGIKALVRAFITMQKRDGQLKLMKPPPRIRQVLEITRLLQVFEVFEDEESARNSFGG